MSFLHCSVLGPNSVKTSKTTHSQWEQHTWTLFSPYTVFSAPVVHAQSFQVGCHQKLLVFVPNTVKGA